MGGKGDEGGGEMGKAGSNTVDFNHRVTRVFKALNGRVRANGEGSEVSGTRSRPSFVGAETHAKKEKKRNTQIFCQSNRQGDEETIPKKKT